MNVYEMEGFLRGKCLPGDMKVNESDAQYLVRKFSELQSQNADMAVQLANAESKCRELAAENVTLNDKMNRLATWPGIEFYSSAWEFSNLDGNDALEFMCDVKTPATDAILAEVREQESKRVYESILDNPAVTDMGSLVDWLEQHAEDSASFAAQLRQGAAL
ncbi:hypothetical protein AZ006_000638 [Citrobacter freundii]|uniref:hypothetical protein n=1 Tax=Citrobacter freundii TaxID=546 RepID=UPI000B6727D3|nr:hypothetical protein [Citrobacter freundii]OUE72479.1 hypothetical protein AZ006_000638 [Citrobacter freundii]